MYVLNWTISGFESGENGILVCRPLAVEAIQRPFPAYFCNGRSYNIMIILFNIYHINIQILSLSFKIIIFKY